MQWFGEYCQNYWMPVATGVCFTAKWIIWLSRNVWFLWFVELARWLPGQSLPGRTRDQQSWRRCLQSGSSPQPGSPGERGGYGMLCNTLENLLPCQTYTALAASSPCDLLNTSNLSCLFHETQSLCVKGFCHLWFSSHQLRWHNEELLGVFHHEGGHTGQDWVARLWTRGEYLLCGLNGTQNEGEGGHPGQDWVASLWKCWSGEHKSGFDDWWL